MSERWRFGVIRGLQTDGDAGPLVLKIGGSLLSSTGWPRLLDDLIAGLGAIPLTLIVGGGAIVEGLREIDAAAPQPPRLMHDLAVDAMHFTARLVAKTTGLSIMSRPACSAAACILDVPLWLMESGEAKRLPAGWDVTSDSIAARVARGCGAELLLAKAAVPPPYPQGDDQAAVRLLAESGWVDRFFPSAAAGLATIRWCTPNDAVATTTTHRRGDS
jgi:aspartokinase-like uncharacterized kinase